MRRTMILALALMWLVGCGSSEPLLPSGGGGAAPLKIDHNQASTMVAMNINTMFGHSDNVVHFIGDMQMVNDAFAGGGDEEEHLCPPSDPNCAGPPPDNGDEKVDLELDKAGKDLVEFIQENIMSKGQIESQNGSTVVYRIKPDKACDKDDKKCNEFLSKHPVRVVAASFQSGNVNLGVVFGDVQLEVILIEIHANKLAVTLDLGATKSMTDACMANPGGCFKSMVTGMVDTLQDDDPNSFDAKSIEGKLRVSVIKTGAQQARVSFEVTKPVVVAMENNKESMAVSLGASSVAVDADAATKKITLSLNLGKAGVVAPYQWLVDAAQSSCEMDRSAPGGPGGLPPAGEPFDEPCEEKPAPKVNGQVKFIWGGLTGSSSLDENTESLSVKGFGFGATTSSLSLDGKVVASFDFNAKLGRKLDATLSHDKAEDAMVLEISPGLVATLKLAMAPMAKHIEDLPSWTMDETLEASLTGGTKQTTRFGEDGFKITSGTLKLSSTAAPTETVTVNAGQCLMGNESDEGTDKGDKKGHPLLSEIKAGPCEDKGK